MKTILKSAIINSTATALYIILVASFLFHVEDVKLEEPSVLIPIFMLMLFVFSAALTGTLILGKPILLYLEGKKKESVSLLAYTLGIFFLTILLVFAVSVVFAGK
ncbi:MAG: hypothetical protein WC285_03455 [Candidatus Gracilibacteria bacterium]|jgi:hypothetical protein